MIFAQNDSNLNVLFLQSLKKTGVLALISGDVTVFSEDCSVRIRGGERLVWGSPVPRFAFTCFFCSVDTGIVDWMGFN